MTNLALCDCDKFVDVFGMAENQVETVVFRGLIVHTHVIWGFLAACDCRLQVINRVPEL